MVEWRPSISAQGLQRRARMLARARAFFADRNVLEVETPLLTSRTVTDPNIQSLAAFVDGEARYLQTSPEYAMKRLLAAGVGDIYQICKSFRAQEKGAVHNPEFTLIEWYRREFSLQQIMRETVALIEELLFDLTLSENATYVPYADAVRQKFGTAMTEMPLPQLRAIAAENGSVDSHAWTPEQLYDFIFSSVVAPTFSNGGLTVVFNYPASQAALAKLNDDDKNVAQRFEVFYGTLELANGFVELTDAEEQLMRFEQDNQQRLQQGLAEVEIDRRLISAIKHGLPDCAGVAVGFDRVAMLASRVDTISEVISFDWESA